MNISGPSSPRVEPVPSDLTDVGSALLLPFEDAELAARILAVSPRARITIRTKKDLSGIPLGQVIRTLRADRHDVVVGSLFGQTVPRSMSALMLLLALSKAGRKAALDENGRWTVSSSPGLVLKLAPRILAAIVLGVIAWVSSTAIVAFLGARSGGTRVIRGTPSSRTVLYIRPDLGGGAKAGGSISHTRGVIGAFLKKGFHVVYVADRASRHLPEEVEQVVVRPVKVLDLLDEMQMIFYNLQLLARIYPMISRESFALVYQRHALHNYAGVLAGRLARTACILEVNSSEVWIRRSWSRLILAGHAERAERVCFSTADCLSLVSEGVRDQLTSFGIPDDRIVISPNGVDPDRFRPDIDGSAIRDRYGIHDEIVIGFIGTFTSWHGVETLRDAILHGSSGMLNAHFLMIGDGDLRSAMQQTLDEAGLRKKCTFTGFISHDEAPMHLAACDILVSPHLGFKDGQQFFGSPTKLFEYMAMGKAIVASLLGQIGEVLEHERTALLFQPGNTAELVESLVRLANDASLRSSLGQAARAAAVARHTWEQNLGRVLLHLEMRSPGGVETAV